MHPLVGRIPEPILSKNKENGGDCCYVVINTVLPENLVGLGFLWSVSYIKSIPTPPKKSIRCGEKWPKVLILT